VLQQFCFSREIVSRKEPYLIGTFQNIAGSEGGSGTGRRD
jgi:hypothetical protein